MKRPFGVVASAIFVLLGSLAVFALFVVFGITAFMSKDASVPPQAKMALPMAAALFGVLGTWGITTAIGLFGLRNWARISIVVFSVFLAFGSLVTGPVMLFIPPPPGAAQNFRAVIRVMAVVYGALGLLGSFWVYYFSRRATRELFRGAASAESARPLSISIIGWWLLVSGMIAPVGAFFRVPAIIFAWVFTGWAAVALNLLYGSIGVCLGYGLLRLKPLARVATIWLLGFGAVNSVVFSSVPGWDARFATLMSSFSFGSQPPPPVQFPAALLLPVGLIAIAVPAWFVVAAKSSFERASQP